MICTEL